MKKLEDFKRGMIWKRDYPSTPAVRVSDLLQRAWKNAQSVVNDDQGAVVLFGKDRIEGILIPPSLIYENRRKLPITRHLEPVFHVSEKEFRDSYSAKMKSNICADFLRSGSSVVVLNKVGAPVLGLVHMQEAALLEFDENARARYHGKVGDEMFSFGDPYEEGSFGRNELVCILSGEHAKLTHALDVLDEAKQDRDSLHRAICNMRFDMT